MPNAIKYGMKADEFWHSDIRVFKAYQRAYYDRAYENAWLNGLYTNIAVNYLAGNIMKKKGAKPFEYPDKPFSPYDEAKKRVTKENLESSFRDMMSNTTNWLKERNKKK